MDEKNKKREKKKEQDLDRAAEQFFNFLASRFPVCCASDEFHYFPQVPPDAEALTRWDNLSSESVRETCRVLSRLESAFQEFSVRAESTETREDALVLRQVSRTLREQLEHGGFLSMQPTFYLSVAGVGLAETIEQENREAFEKRCRALSAFLSTARANLGPLPPGFKRLGLEMCEDLLQWTKELAKEKSAAALAATALSDFKAFIRGLPRREDFRLEPDFFNAVIKEHLTTGRSVEETSRELEEELADIERMMAREAEKNFSGLSWQEALERIPAALPEGNSLLDLCAEAVDALGRHCVKLGLLSEEERKAAPVKVEPVPRHLRAVRSAAAYSMPPGHPPKGGVFHLLEEEMKGSALSFFIREFPFLAAHETYPGHHLLDLRRWSLDMPRRRCLEFPLFYEGWACFAEDLALETAAVSEKLRLVLLRRHFRRAARGLADLMLNSGRMGEGEAAALLCRAGMNKDRAKAALLRYQLKPGYQVCYAIGRRRFTELFRGLHGKELKDALKFVLNRGELPLSLLKPRLREDY